MSDMDSKDSLQFVIADSDSDRDEDVKNVMSVDFVTKIDVEEQDKMEVEKSPKDNTQISSKPMEQTLSKSQKKRLKKKNKNKKNISFGTESDVTPIVAPDVENVKFNDETYLENKMVDKRVDLPTETESTSDRQNTTEEFVETKPQEHETSEESDYTPIENTPNGEVVKINNSLEQEKELLDHIVEVDSEQGDSTEDDLVHDDSANGKPIDVKVNKALQLQVNEEIREDNADAISEFSTPVTQIAIATQKDINNPFLASEQDTTIEDKTRGIPLVVTTSEDETKDSMDEVPIEEISPVNENGSLSASEEPVIVYRYVEVASKKKRMKELTTNFVFGLAVVDFDHLSGPELQYWLDDDVINGTVSVERKVSHFGKVWPYFPFQALPDGVHKFDETFTQFTLCYDELMESGVDLGIEKVRILSDNDIDSDNDNEDSKNGMLLEDPNQGIVTLFGCACIRQLDSRLLKEEKKRSVVQKSVVLITRAPMPVQMKEKLSIVTKSWFEQYNFEDLEILKLLYENLTNTYNKYGFSIEDDELYEDNVKKEDNEKKVIRESDFFLGLNFQDVVLKLRRNLLVILKCLILSEYKILIFSKDLNELSNTQYTLVSLISNLILNMEDSGYPLLDKHLHEAKRKVQSLKSSDRLSMLKFLGLPLHVFGQGSFFQPYLTLQQISYLTNVNTKSFLVGSSNDILLDHKKDWFDIIVFLDEKEGGIFSSLFGGCKIEILNPTLKEILNLSSEDKRFIDGIISAVENLKRKDGVHMEGESSNGSISSKTINSNVSIDNELFMGGNDFIRNRIEDYIIGFLSSIKYDNFINYKGETQEGLWNYKNEIGKFNKSFVTAFKKSRVYKEWNAISEDELFSFFPRGHIIDINLPGIAFDKVEETRGKGKESIEKLKSFFSWKHK